MDIKDLTQTILYAIAAVLSIALAIGAIITYVRGAKVKIGRLEMDFRKDIGVLVKEGKTKIPGFYKKPPEQRQYLLLKQYHSQGLAQSRISFWFSLIFASLGFAVIIIAILTMDKDLKFTEQGRTFITLTAGTIIDAVAALFFVQSNKARRLMSEFFDKLRADRKFEESLQLADQIPDSTLQSRLKILLALNFAEVKSTNGILSSMFNMELQSTNRNETEQKKPSKPKEDKD